MLNDMIQSLLLAVYPVFKDTFHLSFTQVGLITFTYQLTASLLQPFVGMYTDKRPLPYSLSTGMLFTLSGLLLMSSAASFPMLLLAAALVGTGSSVFHPESSRVARMASGGRHGFAQSFFQVGGNAGTSLGPLIAAYVILPQGQHSIAWFSGAALLAVILLSWVGRWYKTTGLARMKPHKNETQGTAGISPRRVGISIAILGALVFSKYFYIVSITSYYTFYLMDTFHIPVKSAEMYLFVFLAAVAAGTFIGGPVGDRIGRKYVIWCSILGVLPFTLALPYANLFWTGILSVVIGLILASAFSAIVVYAQELLPGRIGMISGVFYGFAFGMGGLSAAILGVLADHTSINFVYHVCAYLPAIGLLAGFLPDTRPHPVLAALQQEAKAVL